MKSSIVDVAVDLGSVLFLLVSDAERRRRRRKRERERREVSFPKKISLRRAFCLLTNA